MEIKAIQRFLLERGMEYFYAIFVAGYFLLPSASGHRRQYYVLVLPAVLLLWRELADFYRDNVLAGLLLLYAAYMMSTLLWSVDFESGAALEALGYSLCVLSFCYISGYLWIRRARRMDLLAHRATWLAAAAALIAVYLGRQVADGVGAWPSPLLPPDVRSTWELHLLGLAWGGLSLWRPPPADDG